ncbi:MAG: LysR family transcriptional regulator [Betaproteobacteria bacterium]|nr:LysR family transcriptional regulator [Betaproteobacteria bacterium]NBT11227.1 LysR family transcriptional regulator [Betaproteobacteria bacterium]NBU50165.1 LysR family transcriptional regulator [Betaproteobacteria bacterium]
MPPQQPSPPLNIQLRYELDADGTRQSGAELRNPLFDLLHALESHGSIKAAATALGQSYRHVWGSLRQWEAVLGQELILWHKGRRATLTDYSQRLIFAERQARVRMTPHLEALRAELGQVLREAADSRLQFLNVAASHDLGVGRLQELATERGLLHMKLRFTGSEQALRDLNEGVCDMAGFHVPRLSHASAVFKAALGPHLRPGEHKLISSHRRVQGWMMRREPAHSPRAQLSGWAQLRTTGTRLVNRQPGSGTRLLLDHLLQEQGLAADAIDGYHSRIEHTHVAVAAMIAGGTADIGLGMQAVAQRFGLHFEPLVEEDYYLVCLKEGLDSDSVRRLRELLAHSSWAAELANLPGCTAERPGEVLSLVQALPWWQFRRPRARAG